MSYGSLEGQVVTLSMYKRNAYHLPSDLRLDVTVCYGTSPNRLFVESIVLVLYCLCVLSTRLQPLWLYIAYCVDSFSFPTKVVLAFLRLGVGVHQIS